MTNSFQDIFEFLAPIHFSESNATEYKTNQLGKQIKSATKDKPDIDDCDLLA